MERRKKGEVREDGRIFFRYQKRGAKTYEVWLSSEKFQQYNNDQRKTYERHVRNAGSTDAAKRKRSTKHRRWRNSDPVRRLGCNVRSRIHETLKSDKTARSVAYLGCGSETLRQHLEAQFTEGMSWDNYGLHGWHVDHVKPLASAKTLQELHELLHYTNLQPLWGVENMRKGARVSS